MYIVSLIRSISSVKVEKYLGGVYYLILHVNICISTILTINDFQSSIQKDLRLQSAVDYL